MKKNDIITLTVTDISEDGSGIGRYDSLVVFCRGMLPDESGEVKIIKVTKSYCISKLLRLINISPDRLEPPCCDNFIKGCGGCTFCHLNYKSQLKYKENRVKACLERIGNFTDISLITKNILPSSNTQGYRNKSIYPFALEKEGNKSSIVCGFYAPSSHRVIPIKENCKCGLENDLSAEIRRFTTNFVNYSGFSVYDETTNSGLLRALMIRTNRDASEAMVVLILNSQTVPSLMKAYASELISNIPGVVSVYACLNTKNTNVVLTGELHLILGNLTIIDKIGNFDSAPKFEISPFSFYQVNPFQTELLYDAVYKALPKEIFCEANPALIYDIYCGIGTIGLYLLSRLQKDNVFLVGVEYVEAAVNNAKKNALTNGCDKNSEFFCGDAALVTPTVISKYGKPSIIILDPPRKGCDSSLIETVLSAEPDCIIYVSCNPATLARDLKLLCADNYICSSVCPVDMFPQSTHVETVVKLIKKGAHAWTPSALY